MNERSRLFAAPNTTTAALPSSTSPNSSVIHQRHVTTTTTVTLNNKADAAVVAEGEVDESSRSESVRDGIRTGALLLLGLVALGVILVYLEFIMIPLVISRFLVYAFQPFMNVLTGKWRIFGIRLCIPKVIAAFLAITVIFGVFFLLGLILVISLKQVIHESDVYLNRFEELKAQVIAWGESFGYSREEVLEFFPDLPFQDWALQLAEKLLHAMPVTFIVLLFTLYMLLDFEEAETKSDLRSRIDFQIRKYVVIKIAVSITTGVLVGLTLFALHAKLSFFFGLLAFILNFIPNIGATAATFLPMPIVLLDPSQSWIKIALAFFIPAGIQFVTGNVLEPGLLGRALDMPPVTVFVCLMFWGGLWGVPGAIIAVRDDFLLLLLRLFNIHHFHNFLFESDSTDDHHSTLPAWS
eukprot:TRINITY_DN9919_c0_g3_i1.p1 TRINITY_DN9919_c0_g3~~TRINITY_DN9919_c0_g3_i1.p1  ORF type:complete len:410 (-),score=72.04 TRINITY_DN9919_c0_g3_i1:95-1324(-)